MARLHRIIEPYEFTLGIGKRALGAGTSRVVVSAADVLRIVANLPAGTGWQIDSQFKIFRLCAGGRHKNTDTDKQ